MRTIFYTATLGFIALAAWLIFNKQHAAAFFSDVLEAQRISETVSVGGSPYQVKDGNVWQKDRVITGEEALPILKLTYALTLAKRHPLFSLEGSDPWVLATATEMLARVQEGYVELQSTAAEQALVRNLYPINFLSNEAQTEIARRAFIESPSDRTYQRYDASLTRTLVAYKKDLSVFRTAFTKAVPSLHRSYFTLEGITGTSSAIASLDSLALGAQKTAALLDRRTQCLRDATYLCDSQDIQLPQLYAPESAAVSSNAPPAVSSVVNEYKLQRTRTSPAIIVALAQSDCARGLAAPYYFAVYEERPLRLSAIDFINDILFLPIRDGGEDSLFHYFMSRGASYFPLVPTAPYQCPSAGSDFSRIYATLQVARTLGKQPGVLSEDDVISSFKTALDHAETNGGTQKDTLTALTLMLHDKSAGLDWLVEEIARFGETNLRMKQGGVPIATAPDFLFLAESSFFSLFQGYNLSVGQGVGVSPATADPLRQYQKNIHSWLKASDATRDEMNVSLRLFVSIHKQI